MKSQCSLRLYPVALFAQENRTALWWACGRGYEVVITILIEFKADVNTQSKVSLFLCILSPDWSL